MNYIHILLFKKEILIDAQIIFYVSKFQWQIHIVIANTIFSSI